MQQRDERAAEIEDQLASEFQYIVDMVEPRSHVLDLGCGSGALLKALQAEKHVRAQGVELSQDAIQTCVERGLFVYHGDLDEGLADFPDQSVDYVIATNTLQVLHRPGFLIQEMARVGRKLIVSVPNFAYWRVRWQLLFAGRMPKTGQLPYEWYESPNIHLTTIRDFHGFCDNYGLKVLEEIDLKHRPDGKCAPVEYLPNLRADLGIFLIEGKTK